MNRNPNQEETDYPKTLGEKCKEDISAKSPDDHPSNWIQKEGARPGTMINLRTGKMKYADKHQVYTP